MGAFTINFKQFDVIAMDSVEFFSNHHRIDIKFHDADAYFGPRGYDYFVYWNDEEQEEHGASSTYILISTPTSLEKMNPNKKDILWQIMMENHEINIDHVEKQKQVIVAKDREKYSSISRNSLHIFVGKVRSKFYEKRKESQDG